MQGGCYRSMRAFLGLVIPWSFHIAFLLDGGSFAPVRFLAVVSANKLTAGITGDVYLSAAAFRFGCSMTQLRQAFAGRGSMSC